jgi:hypothetical protein
MVVSKSNHKLMVLSGSTELAEVKSKDEHAVSFSVFILYGCLLGAFLARAFSFSF